MTSPDLNELIVDLRRRANWLIENHGTRFVRSVGVDEEGPGYQDALLTTEEVDVRVTRSGDFLNISVSDSEHHLPVMADVIRFNSWSDRDLRVVQKGIEALARKMVLDDLAQA